MPTASQKKSFVETGHQAGIFDPLLQQTEITFRDTPWMEIQDGTKERKKKNLRDIWETLGTL